MSSEASTAPVAEMAAVTGGRNAISIPPAERGGAWGKAGFGWAVFEFARNPYYLLVVIYIFAPYFARDVIGANLLASGELAGIDPELARQTANASGQAFIASITKYAGFAAGLTAPLLGAALDRGGRRKPVLAFLLAVMAASSFMLWFGQPGDAGLPIGTIAIFLVIAGVCYAYSEVIHNSMLSDSGRPEVLSSISGNGLALGNLAGTGIMLALVLMFALPAAVGWPFERALFGLDVADYEHFRLAGPLSAVWLVVFIIPFFMFVPDAGRKGASWSKAVVSGTRGLLGTLSRAREHKEILKFLFARMIYADAMLALLALGGVYVGLFFDWNFMELIVYAIWMSIFATAGGFLGGTLDRVFGTKNALILENIGHDLHPVHNALNYAGLAVLRADRQLSGLGRSHLSRPARLGVSRRRRRAGGLRHGEHFVLTQHAGGHGAESHDRRVLRALCHCRNGHCLDRPAYGPDLHRSLQQPAHRHGLDRWPVPDRAGGALLCAPSERHCGALKSPLASVGDLHLINAARTQKEFFIEVLLALHEKAQRRAVVETDLGIDDAAAGG